VLDDLLFIRTNENGERKTLFLLHPKALRARHLLMLDKLSALIAWGPRSCLCLIPPLIGLQHSTRILWLQNKKKTHLILSYSEPNQILTETLTSHLRLNVSVIPSLEGSQENVAWVSCFSHESCTPRPFRPPALVQ
jgi:hypothetical protein